jgi:succinyl-CoA synthetase alpha subunit
MGLFTDELRRVLIQGITGGAGRNFAENMRLSGTNLVAGVRPGRGGDTVEGVPVFNTVREAVVETGATASMIAVPPNSVALAAQEAADGGIELAVIYSEGVPIHDSLRLRALWRSGNSTLIGPNSAGILSPGVANLSDMRSVPMRRGSVGVVSKSGTLTYEIVADLDRERLGVSTVVCLGGDPVLGTTADEIVSLFAADMQTEVVVMVGEPGGQAEVRAAERWRSLQRQVPLVALIVGQAAPQGRRLGHAGAIAGSLGESAREKMAALAELGVQVVDDLSSLPRAVASLLASGSAASKRDVDRGSYD